MRFVSEIKRLHQDCQSFLGTIYQSGEKYTKMITKSSNAHKIYPMVVKYSKWPENITIFYIPRPSKVYPN
jgi:hypothetical protein